VLRTSVLVSVLLAVLLAGGCSQPVAVEGKVEVTSPQEYQRKDRHVYKPKSPAPAKPTP
jgi:PBP1b-binding outer membrane lipoprotein LpoB